jgi:hypothetical protein
VYQVAGADQRDADGGCLLDRDGSGAMRHDVAEVVAAIELRRHRGLMPDPDRTPDVAGARHPLGDADGAREAAVTQPTQFAIDQVIGDQAGIGRVVSNRRHDAHHQLMRLLYLELHDQFPMPSRISRRESILRLLYACPSPIRSSREAMSRKTKSGRGTASLSGMLRRLIHAIVRPSGLPPTRSVNCDCPE